ncbi:hypothetical protein Bca4012_051355 [Brassica carinata]
MLSMSLAVPNQAATATQTATPLFISTTPSSFYGNSSSTASASRNTRRSKTTRTMNRFSKVFKSQAFCRNSIVALLHFDSDGVRHDSGDDGNETRRRCYRGVVWSRTQAPPCSIASEWRPQSGGRSSRSSKGETHR